jgi:inosine/xanthosine triphosphate pyrophosphatase family protein
MAELSLEEKNKISHRGKALRKLRRVIRAFMDEMIVSSKCVK